MKKIYYFLLLVCINQSVSLSQSQQVSDRFLQIQNYLEVLQVDNPGLMENVELSVNGVTIQELLRGIANSNGLNISVDPALDIMVVNNFSKVTVSDVLLFLAKRYNLHYEFIGNIISVSAYNPMLENKINDQFIVSYNKQDNTLTLDIQEKPFSEVAKSITTESDKNVILSPGLGGKMVNVYLLNMDFDNALNQLAYANGVAVDKKSDEVYILKLPNVSAAENDPTNGNLTYGTFTPTGNLKSVVRGLSLEIKDINDISLYAEQVSLGELIKAISSELNVNYYIQNTIEGMVSMKIANYTYGELLDYLFRSTDYTYKIVDGVFIIGKRLEEGLRKTEVYPLQHRTVENVIEHIPTELKTGVEIKEFNDLNSLVLSGSAPIIDELISYIRKIDQVVPVIAIEVIILDHSKGRTLRTGLSIGIGEQPTTSGGTALPNVNYQLGAGTVNSILRDLDFGSAVNLGQVTPNFYAQLEAMEANGIVNIRSTPKLATINGHEANLSIGSTQYYVQETSNIIGTQNPQTINTRQYQPVNADLSVTIKPFVSGDNQITLEITVEQSDFTDRIIPEAPPNSVTRSFSSMLRVKNQEMILLGGLEQKSNKRNSAGLPLLARIPILKWLFAKQLREKQNTRLNILIKPTVIY